MVLRSTVLVFILLYAKNLFAQNLCEVGSQYHSLLNTLKAKSHSMACSLQEQAPTQWILFWEADFSSRENFLQDWKLSDCDGFCGNHKEQQYYTDHPENVEVTNGKLKLIAREKLHKNRKYTSSRFITKGKGYMYGRYEFRAKLPKGNGLWPAAWLLASEQKYGDKYWPDNGEIDVMEYFSNSPDSSLSIIHTADHNHKKGNTRHGKYYSDKLTDEYHTYAVEWSPNYLRFYVDNKFTFEYPNEKKGWQQWPFDQPFNIIINMAVGSHIDSDNIDLSKGNAVDFTSIKVFAPVGGDFCKPALSDDVQFASN